MNPRLGPYELLAQIGSGGMATVWTARRSFADGVHKAVAVKILDPGGGDPERRRRAFREELRLSMLLSHSNIVQVFDGGRDRGRDYLVMEWVDGVDLSRLMAWLRERGERLPDAVVAHVTGEILRALDYVHNLEHEQRRVEVIHRDISPHNVLVSVSGEVKVTDFGIARLSDDETTGLHIKGKLRYMAPEQLRGESRTPLVDLYAVGAVLHELLTGTRLRSLDDISDLHAMAMRGEIPKPEREDIPQALERLRVDLLAPDPADRLGSAARALEHLEPWADPSDARSALAKLCREITGVDAPRSAMPPSGEVIDGERPSVRSPLLDHDGTLAGTATRTMPGAQIEATPQVSVPTGSRRWVLWVSLIAGGLALALYGYLGRSPDPAPAEPVTTPAVPVASAPEPDESAGSEAPDPPDNQGEVSPAPPDLGAPEPAGDTVEVEAASAPDPAPAPRPTRRRPGAGDRARSSASCGNGSCERHRGESCRSCVADCGCREGERCVARRGGEIACVESSQGMK